MPGRTAQKSKMQKRLEALRDQLWGKLDPDTLWNINNKSFVSIPRTMPHILKLIDELTVGTPASSAYFSLCCRNWFDNSMVEVKDRSEMAFESGFTGPRAVTTWTSRMRLLRKLGFIDAKESDHEFRYVLILNPHVVLKRLASENKIPRMEFYTAMVGRGIETSGKDFIPVDKEQADMEESKE